MKGTIGIESLEIHCIVGILPQERVQEQDLIVDIQELTWQLNKVLVQKSLLQTIFSKAFFVLKTLVKVYSLKVQRDNRHETIRFHWLSLHQ